MGQCKLIIATTAENRTCGVQKAAFFMHGAQNEFSKEQRAKSIIISLRENKTHSSKRVAEPYQV
jgi:hypothetical protein